MSEYMGVAPLLGGSEDVFLSFYLVLSHCFMIIWPLTDWTEQQDGRPAPDRVPDHEIPGRVGW